MNQSPFHSLHVAKISIEAPVASFRYPHFLIGRQPTFDMPPPSTILGLIACALGEWPNERLQFAYGFTFRSKCGDLEHQHIIERKQGNFPSKIIDPLWREPLPAPGKKLAAKDKKPRLLQKPTEATVQPHVRDFLFDVKLDLYVSPYEIGTAFCSPTFPISLGRSQDLACVRSVDALVLEQCHSGYVEHCILPITFRRNLPWGTTCLLPEYIEPTFERFARFAPYIVLRERVYFGMPHMKTFKTITSIEGEATAMWYADPISIPDGDGKRLLWFHSVDPTVPAHAHIS